MNIIDKMRYELLNEAEEHLKKTDQESVSDKKYVGKYKQERLGQFGNQGYNFLNDPDQSQEDFKKEVEDEIKLIKSKNGDRFYIVRVFNSDKENETIGYITYRQNKWKEDGSILIFDLTAFRTLENLNEKGKGSVTLEMKTFIENQFKNNQKVSLIQFTCIDDEDNRAKHIYQNLFPNITPTEHSYKNRAILVYNINKDSVLD